MAWKIFNIGKANSEIERLEKEVAALKAAPPAVAPPTADATQLAEAIESNSQISKQLEQANTDLATANESLKASKLALEKANTDLSVLGDALKTACSELKLEISQTLGQTPLAMVTALKDGVSSTLAKMNVKQEDIPAGKASSSQKPESNKKKNFTEQCLEANKAKK